MIRLRKIVLTILLVLIGSAFAYLITNRPVTIIVDGESQVVYTHAITVKEALEDAQIASGPMDILEPGSNASIGWTATIRLTSARPVTIYSPAIGGTFTFSSIEQTPANLLAQVGLKMSKGESLLWNGVPIEPNQPLPKAPRYILQIIPVHELTLNDKGKTLIIRSTDGTIGRALWGAGIHISSSDAISKPLESAFKEDTSVSIKRAIPITIQTGNQKIGAQTSVDTVGEALSAVGISLQGLDYAIPPENQPLPLDGLIQVIRVREEVKLEETPVSFKSQFNPDPELELDQRRVVEAGQYGVEVTRIRIRYENGQEKSRQTESRWTAVQPNDEIIGYGTKVVIKTLDTPSGKLEYWRAVPVYTTSYSPCRSSETRCYYGTSSGRPVRRGVIAVTAKWYRLLVNQPVYVPGYGVAVIADTGGGIPGKYWIDLGFSDEDYEQWNQNTILYFLTPIPGTIPWTLP
jgi:resuscitation-promoting factor RpfB